MSTASTAASALLQQEINMSSTAHRSMKTLQSLTIEERLRHERCRNYALYGIKTPIMIWAAENKKAVIATANKTKKTMKTTTATTTFNTYTNDDDIAILNI